MKKLDIKHIYFLTALYFTISLIGIQHHELWLDEAQHWLLARDSNSIIDLYNNTRIEGHPLIWSFILYIITRITTDCIWMQFFHILISTTFVIVFLKKAPFNWLFKTIFIFGYFIVFEYNLISRNYSLGVLFLFLACSIFKDRKSNFILLSLYLTLVSNSHLMFSVIAFSLFLTLLLEQFSDKQFFQKKHIIGYFIFGLGLFFIYLQIHSTDSSWLLDPINKLPFKERIVGGIVSFFKGVIPIPDFRTMHFWNSNLIVNLSKPIAAIIALLTYLLPLFLFLKNKNTLFFVYVTLIGTQVFFFVTQRAATRFHGMTYLIIIIALWIEHYYDTENYKFKDYLYSLNLNLLKKPIVYSILIIQFCSGIYAYSMDIIYPFSSAEETIDFTKNKKYSNKEIVTVTCDGTLLSAYLEKKVYFLCDQSLQSFCHWNSSCSANVTKEKTIVMLTNYMKNHKNTLFISYYSLGNQQNKNWIDLNSEIKARFVKKFDNNIVEKSNYYIFEIAINKQFFCKKNTNEGKAISLNFKNQ